jgi:hypothetical protein
VKGVSEGLTEIGNGNGEECIEECRMSELVNE